MDSIIAFKNRIQRLLEIALVNVRAKSQGNVTGFTHHRDSVGVADSFDLAKWAFKRKSAAIDCLSMIGIAQMKAGQLRTGLSARLQHVLREAEDSVDRPHNRIIANKSAFALNAIDPAFLF